MKTAFPLNALANYWQMSFSAAGSDQVGGKSVIQNRRPPLCLAAILVGCLLSGCASNTVKIGPQAGDSAIRVNSDGVYVNPGLLGFGESAENVTITTSRNNSLSIDVSPVEESGPQSRGSAF